MSAGDREVVIIGGGVIGAAIAHCLTDRGVRVRAVERGLLGRAASWASLGVLSHPHPGATALEQLHRQSWSAFPELAVRLREETGIDCGYRACGGMQLAFTAEEADEQQRFAEREVKRGVRVQWIDGRQARRMEPALSQEVLSALLFEQDHHVDNRKLTTAMWKSAVQRGAVVQPQTEIAGFDIAAGRVRALQTRSGVIEGGQFVLAAGAWTGCLLAALGLPAPIVPVRGEAATVELDEPILERVVKHGTSYLVPGRGQRLLMGATVIEAGFDDRVTAGAIGQVIAGGLRMAPGLASARIVELRCGLRPRCEMKGGPIITRAPALGNLWIAAGHYRSGIVLAPGTGQLLGQALCGEATDPPLAAFSLDPDERRCVQKAYRRGESAAPAA